MMVVGITGPTGAGKSVVCRLLGDWERISIIDCDQVARQVVRRGEHCLLDLAGDHGLTDDQLCLVRALEGRTVQVDDLIEETQIPTRRVLSALTVLELDRIVTQESGKRFSLAVALK